MKIRTILGVYFVCVYHLAYADDASSTLDNTLPNAESTIAHAALAETTPVTTAATVARETTTTGAAAAAQSNGSPASAVATTAAPTAAAAETTADTTPFADPSSAYTESSTDVAGHPSTTESTSLVNRLSDQIREIIHHFQQPNPVGFPGQAVLPDPLTPPNVTEGWGVLANGEFYNMTVRGLSNFTVDSINFRLDQMEVYVKCRITNVLVLGNCTLTNMFFSSRGPFNLTLTNVTAEGVIYLVVDPDGTIRANRSVTKMNYQELKFRLGTNNTESLLQSVVNTAGLTVIGAIQPFIQASIDERLTAEVNKQLRDSPKFPALNKMSPVDLAILEGRQYVRSKYDPYTIPNVFDYDSDFLTAKIGPVTLHGLSKFSRVGDASWGIVNRTMVIKIRMITGVLQGGCNFHLNFGKVPHVPGRDGLTKFSARHLQFEAVVHQPVNLRHKPRLHDLQLEVGAVTVQLDGRGSFDYFVELGVRALPQLIRHLLIDALEEPIKRKIQDDILEKIDVEELVSNNLPLFEKLLRDAET